MLIPYTVKEDVETPQTASLEDTLLSLRTAKSLTPKNGRSPNESSVSLQWICFSSPMCQEGSGAALTTISLCQEESCLPIYCILKAFWGNVALRCDKNVMSWRYENKPCTATQLFLSTGPQVVEVDTLNVVHAGKEPLSISQYLTCRQRPGVITSNTVAVLARSCKRLSAKGLIATLRISHTQRSHTQRSHTQRSHTQRSHTQSSHTQRSHTQRSHTHRLQLQ